MHFHAITKNSTNMRLLLDIFLINIKLENLDVFLINEEIKK